MKQLTLIVLCLLLIITIHYIDAKSFWGRRSGGKSRSKPHSKHKAPTQHGLSNGYGMHGSSDKRGHDSPSAGDTRNPGSSSTHGKDGSTSLIESENKSYQRGKSETGVNQQPRPEPTAPIEPRVKVSPTSINHNQPGSTNSNLGWNDQHQYRGTTSPGSYGNNNNPIGFEKFERPGMEHKTGHTPPNQPPPSRPGHNPNDHSVRELPSDYRPPYNNGNSQHLYLNQQMGSPNYPATQTGYPIGNPYSVHGAGSAYQPPPGTTYYPQQTHALAQPAAQPFVPGQTIVLTSQQQSSGGGFGDTFKEALIQSTIQGAIHGLVHPYHHHHHHHYHDNNSPASNGTSTSTIITNNYYNASGNSTNSGTVAGQVQNVQSTNTQTIHNNPPVPPVPVMQYKISDNDLYQITEELFRKQDQSVGRYITMNLQSRFTSDSTNNIADKAGSRLFTVNPKVYEISTIRATRSLYDNFEQDGRLKEKISLEMRKEENLLLDVFMNTNVMESTMTWLTQRGLVDPDDFDRKDMLHHIWFQVFDGSTSGFERIFTSEIYDGAAVVGVQDWIYFDYQESKGNIDYLGYVDKLNLGNETSLLKLNFKENGIIRANATLFVGTLPELEMALYTICFYARPNDLCPVSLSGTKFNIYTHAFRYFGKDIIDLALPVF
ncbi:endoribonuclease CG2145-like [Prorops nasuta]|uniref:endoribonuclease CG2145-like n=1 Tax=Prorops nasuta TaxID=863751 RepID=UPI0034CE187C